MALHFEAKEYKARQRAVRRELEAAGLDGLLMFQQESMYYLTGYDSFGFCFFQCLYLGTDGKLALLTRSADLRQAQHTSTLEDIRIWTDEAGADPALQLRDMLDSLGARGKVLGIETNSYGLTHFNGKRVERALDGFARLEDASDLVNALRAIKSPAELAYVRKAAKLGDLALKAAIGATRAGADEGDILAAQHAAIFSGGGDYPANEFIIGSGRDALLCRYKSGRRKLGKRDQLTLEFAGVYCHYHAAFMRTLIVGEPKKRHIALHAASAEALIGLRGGDEARTHGGRGVRGSCAGDAGARNGPSHAQCLRLFAGCEIHPELDGFAHVLPRQPVCSETQHGDFRPHDSHGFRQRLRHDPGPHLHHRRQGGRTPVEISA